MVRIDENHEAIAHIRMAIENDKNAQALQAQADTSDSESYVQDHIDRDSEPHWIFGSPSGTRLESRQLEKTFSVTDRNFVSFDDRLRSFIMHCFPEAAPHYEELIYVCSTQTNTFLL